MFLIGVLTLGLAGCPRADLHKTLRQNNFYPKAGGPIVLAAYMPWFGRADHISVGYSTLDRVVLERQVGQAKELGISAFLVNWYGPKNDFENRSYQLLQEVAGTNNFRVALLYDENADDPQRSTEVAISDLKYAYDQFIGPQAGPPPKAYLRYDGRPVIFIFPKSTHTDWARVRQAVDRWPDPPLLLYKDSSAKYAGAFDGFYAWVQPNHDGHWSSDGSDWGKKYLEDFYVRMTTKYPDKIAVGAAWPGFDDSRAPWTRNRHMNARCGRTFEESLRLFRRYYNNSRPLPFLLIVTWNDYEEGTAIEKGLASC